MQKIWVVAVREYKAAVLTRAFLIGLALMPIMMFGSIFLPRFIQSLSSGKVKHYAVIDRTPGEGFVQLLQNAAKKRTEAAKATDKPISPFEIERIEPSSATPDAILRQRYELSERIRKGELKGFLEIGSRVIQGMNPTELNTLAKNADLDGDRPKLKLDGISDDVLIRYQSNSPLSTDFQQWAQQELNQGIIAKRFTVATTAMLEVSVKLQPVPSIHRELARMSSEGSVEDGKEVDFVSAFIGPLTIGMLMFVLVLSGATPLMQGIIEEKMQRVAEVLLGSLSPFQLMMGKLLGMVGVTGTLGLVYLGGGYYVAQHYGYGDVIPLRLMPWFIVYQLLAILLYGSVFIAIGAACSDLKETQNLLPPVMLILVFPLLVLTNIIREPDAPLAVWLSLFPPATPILMMIRLSIAPGPPLWQPLLGAGLLLLTTLAFVWAAGRIFRVGILMQGKGASLGELVKWIRHG